MVVAQKLEHVERHSNVYIVVYIGTIFVFGSRIRYYLQTAYHIQPRQNNKKKYVKRPAGTLMICSYEVLKS